MKYSRSQLKQVKAALKDLEAETHEDENEQEDAVAAVSLREAKAIVRQEASDEEKQNKIDIAQAKRELYRNVMEEKLVTFDWQYSIGDAVMIEGRDGKTDFGIVIEMRTGAGKNQMMAYRRSGVKVMSSAGKYWVNPGAVVKIDDTHDDSCN